ncbi:MAG: c-type cytochrome [Bacteroidetes bacterium]|nr:c-type cytochrome [Bacteroidota bacterium]
MKKIILYSLLAIVVIIISLISYVKTALPNVGDPEDLKIEYTQKRIERGNYLANSVAACMDCHSTRNWSLFAGPLVEGTLGKGGEEFTQDFGFPGHYYARNITPYGIGNWTDGELFRAITSGVNKDGKALFPVMPHPSYGKLDREDIYSIIAYLRTLAPITNDLPEAESDFPMNIIINTIPKKAEFSTIPKEEDQLAYGKYLFTMASCTECHTQQEKGTPVEGMEMAGGFEFPMFTGGVVRSANITPDKETGIGNWTEEHFVRRFKMYTDSSYVSSKVEKNQFQTVMPWMMYGTMKESDLKAMFAYIKTLKPIKNEVVKFTAGK